MEEKEIMVDGQKVLINVKIPKEQIEDNSMIMSLDDTIPLEEIVKEVKTDDKE